MRTRLELEQIRNAALYNDGLNIASGWTGQGTLEGDLHAVISQIKTVTGEPHWYTAPGRNMSQMAGDITALQGASGIPTVGGYKYREKYSPGVAVTAGTEVVIPNGRTYTQNADGKNLEVFLNGQALIPGASYDYAESSVSGVIFTFNVKKHEVVEFRVLQ